MSIQLTNACPVNSIVKVDDDHCSHGMFKPDRLYRNAVSMPTHFVKSQKPSVPSGDKVE